jgi:hypothetical protein
MTTFAEQTEREWLTALNRVNAALEAVREAAKNNGADMADELGWLADCALNISAKLDEARDDADRERDRADYVRYGISPREQLRHQLRASLADERAAAG